MPEPTVKTVLIYPYSPLWLMVARDMFPLADIDVCDDSAPVDKLATTWYPMNFSQFWIWYGRKAWRYDVRIETGPFGVLIHAEYPIQAMLRDAMALLDSGKAEI